MAKKVQQVQLSLFENNVKEKKVKSSNDAVNWLLNADLPFEVLQLIAAEIMYVQEHGHVPDWSPFK